MNLFYTRTAILAILSAISVAGFREQLITTIKSCKNGAEVSDAEIEEFIKPLIPKTDEEKCLMACVFKAYNIINGGVYDPKLALAIIEEIFKNFPDKKDKVKAIIEHCGNDLKKNENECELAAEVMQCHEKYEKEVGIY